MSTMYYTYPGNLPIGQTHSKGSHKGMHFTWCIWPLDLATQVYGSSHTDEVIVNEYAQYYTFIQFIDLIHKGVTSMSFDERIAIGGGKE